MSKQIFNITSRIMFLVGLLLLTASALMVGAGETYPSEPQIYPSNTETTQTTLQSQNNASGTAIDPCLMPDVYCEEELVEVTAYSEYDSCHTGESCLMASGKKAYVGAVACPRNIELGTKVLISGTEYTCEDRTSLTYDGRYDIFMGFGDEGYNKAIAWGNRKLQITIK